MFRPSTAGLAALLMASCASASAAPAADPNTSREMIVSDPAAPVGGNPKGDVTIVAYLDYNCAFCKRSAPVLEKLVKTDGKIRLVYKEWPAPSASSVAAAKLALAAGYQGRYETAHKALMGLVGAKIPVDKMTAALTTAGVDMTRLSADAAAHDGEIVAALRRNKAQADGMGFRSTPVYLVGPLKVAAAVDYDQFKDAVETARSRQANN